MKILITGSNGFVGKNLVSTLAYLDEFEILTFNRNDDEVLLDRHTKDCDFVIHLAGVNRPLDKAEFYTGNVGLSEKLIASLKKNSNKAPILVTSSIQAELENDYGKSKKAGEELLIQYGKSENVEILIYRLPNLFGKWSKPFYNSVIATWCYQISRNEKTEISNPQQILHLVYIDDLIAEIILALNSKGNKVVDNYYSVMTSYKLSLNEILKTLLSFQNNRKTNFVANMANPIVSNLYSTYLSYLPTDSFSYDLISHSDDRGSFTEFIKSKFAGQISINVSKPNQSKGEHWHHSKNEKFVVIKGSGLIRFRDIFKDEIIEYRVSDKKFEVVDIPTGYTHNITNLGSEDMITLMWVNEPYNSNNPDTYYKLVDKEKKVWKN